MSAATPFTLNQADAELLLDQVDVLQAMRDMFVELATGSAVQPAQQLVEFPNGGGDFINYLGVLASQQVYGVKTSPYIVRQPKSLVTAWSLLMSMESGQPLLLCDAGSLTTARTAATTALAVQELARPDAKRLAIVGSGPVARAHLRYVAGLRDWQSIRVYSPNLNAGVLAQFGAIDSRAEPATSIEAAVADADVVLLCTSSGTPVLDPAILSKPALITSISTNVARAHEVPPQSLAQMHVYCDYRATTPATAGEMRLARDEHGWDGAIRGDLPELVSGQAAKPDYQRHAFFRSIGLGLEDVALANALYHLQRKNA
ncbi:ornithine cyclodeaminase family protein [Pseudomonas nicosulfuronedens]|uniref:Ornithine cyclodeaminase family protein n=1 Tax=Pseudomonas nicosulfuronedens TaxID=2571105 RepID=A0A5R9RA94_9PSED|nr:ornithine cyclodeaminase family protein [Pseudomonas nicosulfuronedens]MDH1009894.1 ornithine cyclodeaminase family protein [Pseudomonas nicosulfuronedens]MDH1978870.1 ornithine cyclodeaminase family protein [Pseudomonas nicosulfuronedens]MDH2028451.1 ornithine cyclodeaminase family protein [Pseudomonas nicosulfuronedens]TLX70817.1 ornithine cyclodeaminase family protein [Pseudomonas nicosulfuronedens]